MSFSVRQRLERSDGRPSALQVAADWGTMTKGERDATRVYLQEVRGSVPDLPDIADWKTPTPAQRFRVAQAGKDLAGAFGLTFHELLGLAARLRCAHHGCGAQSAAGQSEGPGPACPAAV